MKNIKPKGPKSTEMKKAVEISLKAIKNKKRLTNKEIVFI